jgi:hypothetical protein
LFSRVSCDDYIMPPIKNCVSYTDIKAQFVIGEGINKHRARQ